MAGVAGKVVVVTGRAPGFARDVAEGLAALGARCTLVGPGGDVAAELSDRDDVARAFAAAAAGAAVDVVVHADVDPVSLETGALAEMSAVDWDRRGEAPLRVTLACLQAAHAALRERGGRVVVITPSLAMTGAAGLVPYATAVEGMRSMAKAAARRWGIEGITVNCVAPGLEAVGAGEGTPAGLPDRALGRSGGAGEVAAAVALLAGDGAAFVTGATVAVDGGSWMTP